jgi:hypothetical protein
MRVYRLTTYQILYLRRAIEAMPIDTDKTARRELLSLFSLRAEDLNITVRWES